MNRAFTLLTAALAGILSSATLAGTPGMLGAPNREADPGTQDQRMDWWREARFGMFIHWGIYSVPAGTWKEKSYPGLAEWIMDAAKIPVPEYEPLAKQFNPTRFDAAKWVSIAKDAGQKYIIITSKHHDGFCMWDTAQTGYDIVDATPFKRDVLKELAEECEKQGVRLGFYYSIMDWHHPDAQSKETWPAYVEYMKAQLKELLSGRYGKVAVLWFDGEWVDTWTDEQGKDLYAYCRELQPDIIINNRVGKGRDGMAGLTKTKDSPGDFGTPEQEIPAGGLPGVDWETCMTMNKSWGYHANDSDWKSSVELIRMLCETASKGGNLLLNVGPTAEGEIPPESVERLAEIGTWMDVNHEAIYGTSASPVPPYYWGDSTAKPGTLYFAVYQWPEYGWIRLRGVFSKATRATLLATGEEFRIESHQYGVSVRVPVMAQRDLAATVVKVEFEGEHDVRPRVIPQLDDNRTIVLSVFDATIVGNTARLERAMDKRCLGYWTDPGDFISWDVDIRRTGIFRMTLTGACVGGEGGGEYRIVVGDEVVVGLVPVTGSWTNFGEFGPGPFEITRPGRYTVIIRPERMRKPGGALMNLQGAYLQLRKEDFEKPRPGEAKPPGTP